VTAIVRIWILLSALLFGSGRILSALHQLNRTGCLVDFCDARECAGKEAETNKFTNGNPLPQILAAGLSRTGVQNLNNAASETNWWS
jgi:hypothetical protein